MNNTQKSTPENQAAHNPRVPCHNSTDPKTTNRDFKITPQRKILMSEVIKQRNEQRGIEPLTLEPELLLNRIKQGGFSGMFLGEAFLSAYRTDKLFIQSLGGLCVLDAEAFRLFHQILHIRFVSGWDDEALFKIEQQVKAIMGGA